MRLVGTSDLHGFLPVIPPCDLLLIAGDVCPVSDHTVSYQRRWLNTRFAAWIKACPAERVVWIAGNHDFALELGPPGRRLRRSKADYLQDSAIEIAGLLIYGSPWSEIIGPWAFSLPERVPPEDRGPDQFKPDLAMVYSRIPTAADVVLVHGPPRGFGDLTTDGERAGSPSLRDRLEEVKPKLCLFGHIHEAYGRWQHRGMTMANVSYLDQYYRPVNEPQIFEL